MDSNRLINPVLVKESVALLNLFSRNLQSLASKHNLSAAEAKELYDKVTKGNEGLVADFINSNEDIKTKISAAMGKTVTGFQLTFDHHGADGYFVDSEGKTIPAEIKTTGGRIRPKNPRQRRKTNTAHNIKYASNFKYHFTDGVEGIDFYFEEELRRCREDRQVTIYAGIYESGGNKQVCDLFFLDPEQSVDILNWGKENRCDGFMIQIPVAALLDGGALNPLVNYVYSDPNIVI